MTVHGAATHITVPAAAAVATIIVAAMITKQCTPCKAVRLYISPDLTDIRNKS